MVYAPAAADLHQNWPYQMLANCMMHLWQKLESLLKHNYAMIACSSILLCRYRGLQVVLLAFRECAPTWS